jgi:predicted regulator of Ras-like GTPase activity (Roadblock/LC7/MglB family)
MDAAQALADLTEISAQIDGAVLAGSDGTLVASTFAQEERGKELAGAAVDLLAVAGESRAEGQELVQLQAATPRGSIFVVQGGDRLVAAITGSRPTVGLVFYDLKTCLRMLEREDVKAPQPKGKQEDEKVEKATATKPRVGKATTQRKAPAKKKEGVDEST